MRSLAELIARTAGEASRRLGRGGGTTLPGTVLLRIRPGATAELAGDLRHGSVAISATNGKTTTTRLVARGLAETDHSVVSNRAGANLISGVTASLLRAPTAVRTQSVGLFEVDEAALPDVAAATTPRVITLINLFRDQLDRYGELETLIETWRTMIGGQPATTTLVLNADDPAIASLGADRENVIWFGVDDPSAAVPELAHAADTTRCRVCSTELRYSQITLGHLGHWTCPNGDSQRPSADVSVTAITDASITGQTLTLRTPAGPTTVTVALPGVHNAYNVAAAAATLLALDVDLDSIAAGLAATPPAFGRAERVTVDGRDVVMMLAKNPTGVNANIRAVLAHAGDLHVLALLNDRSADGQDVSWIWDVDWEPLIPRLAQLTLAGDRSRDLGLRFRYAGMAAEMMTITPQPAAALDEALSKTQPGDTLFVLPTYTAMLDLRGVLTDRGITEAFWEDA